MKLEAVLNILKQEIMKNSGLLIAGLFLFIFPIGMNAQTKSGFDFFAGKWNIVVKNTPNGDAKMVVNFEKKNEVVTATLNDSTGKELYKVTKTEIVNDLAYITFIGSQSNDVPLTLKKKDETSITGDIMGMFWIEGNRIGKNN
jgi:hypothetical protein